MRASLASFLGGGRDTEWERGSTRLPCPIKLRIPPVVTAGVRPWGISFMVERETTLTTDKGPEARAKCERMWGRIDNQDVGLEAATI